jgi:hypothetical protein
VSPKKPRGIDPEGDPEADAEGEPEAGADAEPDGGPKISPDVGLCSACTFVRRVESRRGSVFYRCERSAEDPRYPKYPPLPVLTCPGFVVMDPAPRP